MTTTTADAPLKNITALTAPIAAWGSKVGAAVRVRWEAAGAKVRSLLNLPTQDEIAALAARLDEIEAKLGGVKPKAHAEKRVRAKKKARPQL